MAAAMTLTSLPLMAAPVSAAATEVGETPVTVIDGSSTDGWTGNTVSSVKLTDGEKNTYMNVSVTGGAFTGVTNNEAPMLPADTYTMTFRARKTYGVDGKLKIRYRIFNAEIMSGYLTNEWQNFTVSKTIDAETAFYILIRGGNDNWNASEPYTLPFDFDDVVVKNSAGKVIFEWGNTNTDASAWKKNGGAIFNTCVEEGDAIAISGMTVNYVQSQLDLINNPIELYSGKYRFTARMRRTETLLSNYEITLEEGSTTIYSSTKDNNSMEVRAYAYTGTADKINQRTAVALYPTATPTYQPFTVDTAWREYTFDVDVPEGETTTVTGFGFGGGYQAFHTLGMMIDELSVACIESYDVQTELDPVVPGNLVVDGACNEGIPEGLTDNNYTLKWNKKGFVEAPARDRGDQPIEYRAKLTKPLDPTHVYLFSLRMRSDSVVGNTNRARFYGINGGSAVYPMSGYISESQKNWVPFDTEWTTYTFRIDSNTNPALFAGDTVGLRISGPAGPMNKLFLDSFELIDLTEKSGLGYTNLLEGATSAENAGLWKPNTMKVTPMTEDGTDFIRVTDITVNYLGVTFDPGMVLDPGDYKLSFNLRTAVTGETTVLRGRNSVDNVSVTVNGVNNAWKAVDMNFTVTEPTAFTLFVNGGPNAAYVQDYDISGLTLVCFTPPAEANGNLIVNGGFNDADEAVNLAGWTDTNALDTEIVDSNGVVVISARDVGYIAPTFTTGVKLDAREAYRLSFRVRTADLADYGYIRPFAIAKDGTAIPLIPRDVSSANEYHPSLTFVSGEWTTLMFDINPSINSDVLGTDNFKVSLYGSPLNPAGYPSLFVDDMILREVEYTEGGIPNIGIVMMLLHKRRVAAEGGDVVEEFVPTNLIAGADTAANLNKWVAGNQVLEAKTEGKTSYMAASGITVNYIGFTYNSGVTLQPGSYRFSCMLRTSVKGETSKLRVFSPVSNTAVIADINNTWKLVTVDFTITEAQEYSFKICGYGDAKYIQAYDIAELSLIDLREKPSEGGKIDIVNLIDGAASSTTGWAAGTQKLEAKTDTDGTKYLAASGITVNYAGFIYKPGFSLEPGTYEVKVDLRAANKGESTNLRLINFTNDASIMVKADNNWKTASFIFTLNEPTEFQLKICGGTSPTDVQNYDIANVSLVKLG